MLTKELLNTETKPEKVIKEKPKIFSENNSPKRIFSQERTLETNKDNSKSAIWIENLKSEHDSAWK